MRRFLESMGIERERIRLEWIAASEGDKVQRTINEMTAAVRALGPLAMEKRALLHPADLAAALDKPEARPAATKGGAA